MTTTPIGMGQPPELQSLGNASDPMPIAASARQSPLATAPPVATQDPRLASVAAPRLPPPAGEPSTETLLAVHQALTDAAPRVLRDIPENAPLNLFQVMSEIYRAQQTMRDSDKEVAQGQRDLQVDKIRGQAEKIIDAADKSMWATIIQSGVQIASAGAQIFALWRLPQFQTDLGLTQVKAAGVAVDSLGAIGGSIFQRSAQVDQAAGKQLEADATAAAARREESLKFRDNAEAVMRETLQALQAVVQARSDINRKIFA